MKPAMIRAWLSGIGVACAMGAAPAMAAMPATVGVEGALYSAGGGPAADGSYNVTFSLYKDALTANATWTEGPVQIAVKNGLFVYALGGSKPLDAATLAGVGATAQMGIKVEADPELPRKPVQSSMFALRAATAEALDCSGCIAAGQIDSKVLAPFAKSADLKTVASSGNYNDLLNKPDLSVFAQIAALATVATSGNYADLLNKPDLSGYALSSKLATVATSGKYTDLSGAPVTIPVNVACGSGLVVKGLKADGSLNCVNPMDVSSLPPDGLNEISNNLIYNQFVDTYAGTPNNAIKDYYPPGTTDTIAFPDIGSAQALTVSVDVSNSDISKLAISVFDPTNKEFVICGGADGSGNPYTSCGLKGAGLKASYPPNATATGDLTKWVGLNPKGNWILKVVDNSFNNTPNDGQVNSWSIALQTLSTKKIQIKGNVLVDNNVTVTGDVTGANLNTARGYRQTVWENDQLDMTSASWTNARSMVYNKQRADTVLIIDHTEGFNLRGYYGWTEAGYRILVDGNECATPGRIEQTYASYSPTINIHEGLLMATHAICKTTTAGAIGIGNHTVQIQGRRSYGDGNSWGPYWSYNMSGNGNRIARMGVGEIQDNQ